MVNKTTTNKNVFWNVAENSKSEIKLLSFKIERIYISDIISLYFKRIKNSRISIYVTDGWNENLELYCHMITINFVIGPPTTDAYILETEKKSVKTMCVRLDRKPNHRSIKKLFLRCRKLWEWILDHSVSSVFRIEGKYIKRISNIKFSILVTDGWYENLDLFEFRSRPMTPK